MPSERSVQAARAALIAHRDSLLIEGDEPTQLWHLFVSLVELGRATGINMQAEFDSAKRFVEGGGVS